METYVIVRRNGWRSAEEFRVAAEREPRVSRTAVLVHSHLGRVRAEPGDHAVVRLRVAVRGVGANRRGTSHGVAPARGGRGHGPAGRDRQNVAPARRSGGHGPAGPTPGGRRTPLTRSARWAPDKGEGVRRSSALRFVSVSQRAGAPARTPRARRTGRHPARRRARPRRRAPCRGAARSRATR